MLGEGNDVRACEQKTNGCYDWGTVAACGGSQVCSGGACASSCTNQCTAGASQCTSTGQQQDCVTLSSGCTDWSLPKNCVSGQACALPGTSCQTSSACTPGQNRCNGTTIENCNAGGSWIATQTCPQACSNGTCTATTTCSAGAVRCNGNGVETCNSSGTAWLRSQTCAATCSGGLCTGPCVTGQKRCNGNTPETCNSAGTAWTAATACTIGCYLGGCVQADLVVDGVTVTMNGVHKFQNSVFVQNGGKIQVGDAGTLQLIANTISIDSASWISANGVNYDSRFGGAAYLDANDLSTEPGYCYTCTAAYAGGGVIDLRANTLTVNGQITSNGSGFFAGGGSILLAADNLLGTGAVQAVSGGSTSASYFGLVKFLYGTQRTLNPTITGAYSAASLMPPLNVFSSSHPDPQKRYNDSAPNLEIAWQRPFSVNGYYYRFSGIPSDTVTPANGTFIQSEALTIPLTGLTGQRYLHLVTVNSAATVGTVRNVFPVYLTNAPPTVTSTSHPSQGAWSTNNAPYLTWNAGGLGVATDATGYFYVLDKFGDTVPTASTGVFTTNQQVILSNLTDGTWVFHIVARDSMNRITRTAGHYKLFIGTAPALGNLAGSVFDGANASAPIAGAAITINRGLFQTNNSTTSGTYTFNNTLYAGTWEVSVKRPGYLPVTRTVTITAGNTTNENFVLQPAP